VHEPLHLKQVSGVLGIPIHQLRAMNPQYRQDIIPATSGKTYALKIPLEQSAAFIDLQDSVFAYKDSIFFDPGKMVATPRSYSASYRVDLPADKYDKLSYTVKAGDNVGYIADWYDVRASDLRYWNNIRRNLIRSGQKLVIYKPKGQSEKYQGLDGMSFADKQRFAGRAAPTSGGSASPGNTASSNSVNSDLSGSDLEGYVTYTVKSGDTLWEIARKYPGITETDIARLNNITRSDRIRPGQVIRIKPEG
jgi:membrane-bound lytic murein transglycosylase D